MAASTRKRRKAQPSCGTLRKRARKIKNAKKRKQALKKLPKRCKPVTSRPPTITPALVPRPTGTQPAKKPQPVPSGTPKAADPVDGPLAAIPPTEVYRGEFGAREAERLLLRAGFGPRPGDVDRLAAMGLEAAVQSLTRPDGAATLTGAAPAVNGAALDPYGSWGHDHLWWMDRMIRSDQPLVERMALIFHDWFATSNEGVGSSRMMMDQTNLFRRYGLGCFDDLVSAVTTDPAMLLWLSGLENTRWAPNENYARELMELFTLGANRGAYTEADVRDLARALTGFRADWSDGVGHYNFRWDQSWWDAGTKTVFGRSGAFKPADAVRLVLEHPGHAAFFVEKLWSAFVPVPPSDATRATLEQLYVATGRQIRPVVEAILSSPELYAGPRMVKPPVVYAAALWRLRGKTITADDLVWTCALAGQQLYHPPDVSGWDDTRWMDTSTVAGRWWIANQALEGGTRHWTTWDAYTKETPDGAVANALGFWGDPWLTAESRALIRDWGASVAPAAARPAKHAVRQNALRMLIAMSPDFHTS